MLKLVLRVSIVLAMVVSFSPALLAGEASPSSQLRQQAYQWSPLHWAVRYNDSDAADKLARGHNLEQRDALGRTPLHIAAMFGLHEMVTLLLSRGADPNARDQWGVTPLFRLELVQRFRDWDRSEIKELLRAAGGVKKDMRGLR